MACPSGEPIRSGQISVYKVPTASPESDGTAEWNSTGVLVIELVAGSQTGLGFAYTDPSAGKIAEHLLQAQVKSKNAFDTAAIHAALDIETRNMGRPGIASSVIAALDIALWDLKAKLLGLPLVKLLGAARPSIAAYGSGGFTSYSERDLLEQLTGWADDGMRQVKMKIGRQPDADVARVSAAARALKSTAQLFVDANGAYTRKQALRKAEQFGELGVTWFEEPVSSDDRAGLHLLVQRTPAIMDIAAGEYSYTLDDARLLIEAGAVDVMQADVTRCGGITNFMKIAALCEANHLPLSAHTAPTVHAHLCCTALPAVNVEYFFDHVRIESMFFDGAAQAKDGVLTPDLSRSGMGIEFKRSDAEEFRVG